MLKDSLPALGQSHSEKKENGVCPVKLPQSTFVAATRRVGVFAIIMSAVLGIGILVNQPNCVATDYKAAWADIRMLQTNLIRYRTMTGSVPGEAQGLRSLAERPVGDPVPKSWHKLTDSGSLIDPWGRPYQYRNPGKKETNGYDVYSVGPDGQDGTEDDDYAQ